MFLDVKIGSVISSAPGLLTCQSGTVLKTTQCSTVTDGAKNSVGNAHDGADGRRDEHVTRAWLTGD